MSEDEQAELPFTWVEPEYYAKIEGQARMDIAATLAVFDMYGMGVWIPAALDNMMTILRRYGMRVRGVDNPPKRLIDLRNGR